MSLEQNCGFPQAILFDLDGTLYKQGRLSDRNVFEEEYEVFSLEDEYPNSGICYLVHRSMRFFVENIRDNNLKTGLITASPRSLAEINLKRINMGNMFDIVICSQEFGDKRDAEPFLKAAELLNIDPEFCVMVGDSYEDDVLGPKKAGMKSIFLPSTDYFESDIMNAQLAELESNGQKVYKLQELSVNLFESL